MPDSNESESETRLEKDSMNEVLADYDAEKM